MDDRKRYPGEFTTDHPYGFTGKAMDPTTGIYDYGSRHYAPERGRFPAVSATAP